MRSRARAILVGLLLGLASSDPGAAAVLTVTDCGDTTPGGAPGQLRRLVNDAAPGDTIVVPACLITLTGAAGEDLNAGGDLDILKSLTIQGAGARRTVISGGAVDTVLEVFAPAVVTVTDLMIRGGSVESPPALKAAGIVNRGNLTLDRVQVRGNAGVGPQSIGGILNDGTLAMTASTVTRNVSVGLQAGVGGIRNSGPLTLTRSTVSENSVGAKFGGGPGAISNASTGILNLVDSTVSGNASVGSRVTNDGTMIVRGSVFAANGFGIFSTGPATLTNTIVADECSAPAGLTSSGGNLSTDADCGLTGGPGDALVADAGLGPLGPHGGATETHPLLPGSPAIDTALPVPCGPVDQRGRSRPQDGNGDTVAACDKGPFEFTPALFADVAADHVNRGAIEALFASGVTGGCQAAPALFCPASFVTRGQIAVFLLRALEGAGFVPPPATGIFADVPASHPLAPWIEELFRRGITGGCGTAPPVYCPGASVTRGQIAVLLLRVMSMAGFVPPAATGLFADVPLGHPFAPWVEEFSWRGITDGCLSFTNIYCPDDATTRAQVAVFLVRAFGLGF